MSLLNKIIQESLTDNVYRNKSLGYANKITIHFFLKKLNVVILSLFPLSLFRITANYYSHCHRYKASDDLTRVSKQYCLQDGKQKHEKI